MSTGDVLVNPNAKDPYPGSNSGNGLDRPGMIGLKCFHAGVANVVVCDRSVRLLKDNTGPQVVWSLDSLARGEVIGSDAH